jgi:alpha-L-fucosidase
MNRTLCWAVLAAGVLASFAAQAQGPYTADWDSLDKRPVAPWFEDAKFGIFIHWGPYSVPAWAPKGVYSEWYQHWLENKSVSGNGDLKGPEVYNHHVATYGEDFPYYNFGAMFTADQFNPDEWAKLFADAGAKYVVITSKHHDGFCLWPNAQANDRGFAWNSGEVGAKRDLLGELSQAMKKTELKFGFYYSLYEWFHPWWQKDKERFVDAHFLPQVKDLVTRYEPDILWGDGEWEMKSSAWKTPEMLAWLFNESPVKDTVVINDRWGKETRQKHGGYYTTEYQQTSYEHPWEECRGMGFSFGYNRNEDAADYNSPQSLVLMLVDIVSNGGNLLLDIGPDGHGDIPVIMQERLLQMGRWLAANGEAIYGTRRWERTVQWSEGNREYKPEGHYVSGEIILKQTVSPEPGYAAKEAFFTRKGDTLYVVTPRWPSDGLRLKGMRAAAGTTVTLLATGEAGTLAQDGTDVVLTPPAFDPNRITGELGYAYAFAVSPVPELE